MSVIQAVFVRGGQGDLTLEGKLWTQLDGTCVRKMGDAMRHTRLGSDGIHEDRRACTVGSHIVPIAFGQIVVAAVDIDDGIFIKVETIQGISKQVAIHRIQL